jgi:hypothetical protein
MTFYIGVVLLLAELWASIFLFRKLRAPSVGPKWKRAALILLVVGLPLAIASAFIEYPYGNDYRVYGLPFTAAVFERSGNGWRDYVSPLTGVFVIMNGIVFFLLPQLVLGVIVFTKRNRLNA